MRRTFTSSGPQRRMRRLRTCVFGALMCSACGGTFPTAPPPAPKSAATAPLASAYINEILDIMQNHSIKRDRIDWTDLRARIIERAQGAQTIPELYPALSLALGLLNDHHSY